MKEPTKTSSIKWVMTEENLREFFIDNSVFTENSNIEFDIEMVDPPYRSDLDSRDPRSKVPKFKSITITENI